MLRSAVLAFTFITVVYIQHVEACKSEEFRCANELCAPQGFVCDNDNDCGDWSDEQNCPCRSDQFRCANGLCKFKLFKCDGSDNCGDGSDELNCGEGSCIFGVRNCRQAFYQSYQPPLSTSELSIEDVKATPLEAHCSHSGAFLQCMTELEKDCSEEYSRRYKSLAVQKVAYNFACNKHFNEINENWDCVANSYIVQDFNDCTRTITFPGGNCSEEYAADVVDQISSCLNRAITEKLWSFVTNGSEECTQTASNLVRELIKELPAIQLCPGSRSYRRGSRKIDHGLWKKKIQSYFNLKF